MFNKELCQLLKLGDNTQNPEQSLPAHNESMSAMRDFSTTIRLANTMHAEVRLHPYAQVRATPVCGFLLEACAASGRT
jgi:hypothetical protein